MLFTSYAGGTVSGRSSVISMLKLLSMLIFLLFFKPLSAIVYVFIFAFSGLTSVVSIKKNFTWLDIVIIFTSFIGGFFSSFNVLHVYATSGLLAMIFYISFYYMVILIVLLDVRHEKIITTAYQLILKVGLPAIIITGIFFGSVTDTFNGYASIPELFGVEINRVFFPLTGGVNHFGIMVGFCLVVISAFKLNHLEFFTWFISIFVLLFFIDSRGAMLALLCSLFFSKYKFITPYIWVAVPFVMVAFGLFLVGNDGAIFNRENSTLFSQREYLWALGIAGLNVMTWAELLFGYGVNGFTYNSIASDVTAFFEYRDTLGSLHNAHLTLLYDYGLFGFILALIINLKIIKNLKNLNFKMRGLSLKCLIYVSITSATETIYSFNYILILLTFIFISQIGKHSVK